jgi:hypothetical protein
MYTRNDNFEELKKKKTVFLHIFICIWLLYLCSDGFSNVDSLKLSEMTSPDILYTMML